MRIVAEQSGHELLNMGDLAMLQVALWRFREIWPDSEISVLTSQPERLKRYLPQARPLSLYGRHMYHDRGTLLGPLARYAPGVETNLRRLAPRATFRALSLKKRLLGRDTEPLRSYYTAVARADLVVATGGGYLNDEFPGAAVRTRQLTDLAKRFGKPVALLGQGLGPANDPSVRADIKTIADTARLITLREGLCGPRLLRDLEARCPDVRVTGDDAVELAYNLRPSHPGDLLGVGVRLAWYSRVNGGDTKRLVNLLGRLHLSLKADVMALPISFYLEGEDEKAIRQVCNQANVRMESVEYEEPTPEGIIRRTGHCRLVLTGSYHAAVFALAQGIPALGIARSQYYQDKFAGLADLFGEGCGVACLDDEHFEDVAFREAQRLWSLADDLKPYLLRSAEEQIALQREAYRDLKELAG